MIDEKTRTAVCVDSRGELQLVHCRLWENWHGATYLCKTREQLATDHPDLTFKSWAIDLGNASHREELKCAFLSPNVLSIRKWCLTDNGVELIEITRDDIL